MSDQSFGVSGYAFTVIAVCKSPILSASCPVLSDLSLSMNDECQHIYLLPLRFFHAVCSLLSGLHYITTDHVSVLISALLGKIAALRTFSLDKLEYWRESSSGMSSLAYFLAKDTVDHFNTAIKPLVYLSMFYSFTNPRSSFTDHYVVLLCLLYCVTGIAYALAILFQPGAAQLVSEKHCINKFLAC